MSEILTGPDRRPPKFDWRDKAVKLQAEVDRLNAVISEVTSRAERAEKEIVRLNHPKVRAGKASGALRQRIAELERRLAALSEAPK